MVLAIALTDMMREHVNAMSYEEVSAIMQWNLFVFLSLYCILLYLCIHCRFFDFSMAMYVLIVAGDDSNHIVWC